MLPIQGPHVENQLAHTQTVTKAEEQGLGEATVRSPLGSLDGKFEKGEN